MILAVRDRFEGMGNTCGRSRRVGPVIGGEGWGLGGWRPGELQVSKFQVGVPIYVYRCNTCAVLHYAFVTRYCRF